MSGMGKKTYTSLICIDGKRIHTMREIAKATFAEAFLFIEVCDGRFVVRVDHTINMDALSKFEKKYTLCKVRIYKEVLDRSMLLAEKKK